MEKKYTFNQDMLPPGFCYPEEYLHFIASPEKPIWPLWSLDEITDQARSLIKRLNTLEAWKLVPLRNETEEACIKRYPPSIKLVPFASRDFREEAARKIACFDGNDQSDNPKIIYASIYDSSGFHLDGEEKDFSGWLAAVTKDSDDVMLSDLCGFFVNEIKNASVKLDANGWMRIEDAASGLAESWNCWLNITAQDILKTLLDAKKPAFQFDSERLRYIKRVQVILNVFDNTVIPCD